MDVSNWVASAIAIVVGAYIVFQLIIAFSNESPAFGQYGWTLMGAYIVGAVAFLKRGLFRS